MFKIIAMII